MLSNTQFDPKYCEVKGHHNCQIIVVCLDYQCNNQLLCSKCILQHENHNNNFLFLEDLINKNEFELKKELWPPSRNGAQIKQMMEDLENPIQEKEIDEYFAELQKCLVNELNEMKEKIKQKYLLKSQADESIAKLKSAFAQVYSLAPLRSLILHQYFTNNIDKEELQIRIKDQIKHMPKSQVQKDINQCLQTLKQQGAYYMDKEAGLKIMKQQIIVHVKEIEHMFKPMSQFNEWCLVKSTKQQSDQIICLDEGICYQGAGTGSNELLFSNMGWDSGEHEFEIQFEPFDLIDDIGSLFIGIVPDDEKEKLTSFGSYPNRDLLGDSSFKMDSINNNCFKQIASLGGIVQVQMNIDQNIFTVFDNQQTVVYKQEEGFQLKGKKWAFILGYSGENAKQKIKLLNSH